MPHPEEQRLHATGYLPGPGAVRSSAIGYLSPSGGACRCRGCPSPRLRSDVTYGSVAIFGGELADPRWGGLAELAVSDQAQARCLDLDLMQGGGLLGGRCPVGVAA